MVFTVVASIFLCIMMYVAYKVYKISKLNDPVLLSMIFFLNLTLMSKIFFYIVNAYEDYYTDPDS